jgi:hypothetical protein
LHIQIGEGERETRERERGGVPSPVLDELEPEAMATA